MLVWVENVVSVAMFHDGGDDDVFHEFAADACEGDGAIVCSVMTGAFLVNGSDIGVSPF